MLSGVKGDALNRLSYIEGHFFCIRKIPEDHLSSCVVAGITAGLADEMLEELRGLQVLTNK